MTLQEKIERFRQYIPTITDEIAKSYIDQADGDIDTAMDIYWRQNILIY
jgi:hypothetical protein